MAGIYWPAAHQLRPEVSDQHKNAYRNPWFAPSYQPSPVWELLNKGQLTHLRPWCLRELMQGG